MGRGARSRRRGAGAAVGCGVSEVREPPRASRRRILQGATTSRSRATARRSNAAGPDASALEWPRHFWSTTPTFRCNGSDGYLAWIDHVLGIRETAHVDLSTLDYDYDFRVLDSPNEVRRLIEARNDETGRARMVAGYCLRWKSKKDPEAWDVVLGEHDFRMRWNLTQQGPGWLGYPESINEIGCIHTCQGLDLDYVGVVIGPDLVVEGGELVTRPEARDRYDSSIRGHKKRLKEDPERARADARRIILNTYRTLMTRGMKGCYVYAVDEGGAGVVAGWGVSP